MKKEKSIWIIMIVFLTVLAAILFFSYCLYSTSFTNDEFISMSVAANFASGKGFCIDVCLDHWASYTRAWPSTLLLAGWIKLFGVSEFSCRSLSAIIGLLFTFSTLYITYKMFKNMWYSFCATLMVITDNVIIKYFGTVRMYSLELLLTVWMYYFIYMWISRSNPFFKKRLTDGSHKFRGFISEAMDFHWGYFFAALPLLILNSYNMINSLIPLGWICIYIVIKAATSKEKKYKFAVLIGCFGIVLMALNIIFYFCVGHFLFLGSIFRSLIIHFSVGLKIQYLTYILGVGLFGKWYLAIPVLLYIVVSCACKRKLDDEIIYIISICFFTTIFFSFFTSDHSYSSRYIIMLIPWVAMLYAYAVICTKWWNFSLLTLGVACFIILKMIYGGRYVYMFAIKENSLNTDFMTAYGKISEYYDIESEEVPVAYHMLRKYYYTQVVPESRIGAHRALNRDKMTDDLIEFAKEYPEGIITVERIKLEKTSQDFDKILLYWTDRLAGADIDNTGVNVSHYCFINPKEFDSEDVRETVVQDGVIYISLTKEILNNNIKDSETPQVLFVALDYSFVDGSSQTRFYGLLIPENVLALDNITYALTDEMTRKMDNFSITEVKMEPRAALYSGGVLNDFMLEDVNE